MNYFIKTEIYHSKFNHYIEDITRWCEDMNFIFEWQNNILRTSDKIIEGNDQNYVVDNYGK